MSIDGFYGKALKLHHRWFQEARKSRNSPYRDYFVWSDTPEKYSSARIIFLDVEKSNWVRKYVDSSRTVG